MSTMTYKGLSARVDFDPEDEIFVGRIAGINDVVGFHSDTAAGLKEAFHDAVDGYIAACEKVGKEPERAFSGKLMLRVKPELHQGLALVAELSGKSLNQLCEELLAMHIGNRNQRSHAPDLYTIYRSRAAASEADLFMRVGDQVKSGFGDQEQIDLSAYERLAGLR